VEIIANKEQYQKYLETDRDKEIKEKNYLNENRYIFS